MRLLTPEEDRFLRTLPGHVPRRRPPGQRRRPSTKSASSTVTSVLRGLMKKQVPNPGFGPDMLLTRAAVASAELGELGTAARQEIQQEIGSSDKKETRSRWDGMNGSETGTRADEVGTHGRPGGGNSQGIWQQLGRSTAHVMGKRVDNVAGAVSSGAALDYLLFNVTPNQDNAARRSEFQVRIWTHPRFAEHPTERATVGLHVVARSVWPTHQGTLGNAGMLTASTVIGVISSGRVALG